MESSHSQTTPAVKVEGAVSKQKRAVIVGATSGIGREVAKLLLEDGWRIGIAGRRLEKLKELQALAPDRTEIGQIDVCSEDAPVKLRELIEKVGGMDLYFHSSGIGFQNKELDPEVELGIVRTNSEGFVRMAGEAFRYFRDHGISGQIAVISSIAGTRGMGAAPAYSATKAMDSSYLQALAQLAAIQHLDIRFTDIRPGFVDTDFLNDSSHYPMLMRPERVAKAAVRAVLRRRRVVVIDWRYCILVFFWRLVPRFLWEKMRIG